VTICNRCGGVLSAQAKICPHCGALVSEAAGNMGGMMSARKRAQERERAPLPPTFDPFAALPASPFPGMPAQPFGAGAAEPSAGPGRWQASSLPGSEQLPDWMRPSTSDLERRGGASGQSAQPRAGNDPFAQRPNQGAAPISGQMSGVPPANPLAPAPRPPMSSSPYRSGGRNATDDLFAASSLLDQNKLPEWLRSRQERNQAPGHSAAGGRALPPSEPRPAPQSGADPFASSSVSENLPDWLRAMDPGAPPPSMSGRFGSAGPRSQPGAGGSLGASRSANQERRELPERSALSADPFGGNQAGSFGVPSRDPFGSSRSAPGNFGAPPAGGVDPFAGRSSLGQPSEPRPRPLSTTGPQGSSPAGIPQPGASPFGPAIGPGNSPFGAASGPLGGPASASPFSRQREPGASPFGSASAPGASFVGSAGNPGALPLGAESAPGAPRYSAPSSASPFGAASAFDAFAPRSAPQGSAPANRESAAPFGERFTAPAENANLPDWLRIPEEEPRSSRPAAPPSSTPLYRASELPLPPRSAPPYRAPEPSSLPSSAPLYRPAEYFPSAASAADAQRNMPASAQSSAAFGGASAPSASTPLPPSPFEASSLIDESALPGWLGGTSQTEPLPLPITVSESVTGSRTPQEAGGRNFDGAAPPRQGAAPTADQEEDLPDWLRQVYSEASVPVLENPPARTSGGEKAQRAALSAQSAVPQAEISSIFNASDLLDHRAVPDWLREASETSPLAGAETPAPAGAKAGPGAQAPGAGPLSAQSLLDEASLPDWLRKIEADGPPAPFKSPLPTTGGLPGGTTSGIFSAAELIDTNVLPAWLKTEPEKASAPGTAQAPAAAATPAPAPSLGSSSNVFSAAELIDTQMLPTWLKTTGAESRSANPAAAAPEALPSAAASGVFSPAELIDTQALPAWLKQEGKQAEGEKAASLSEPSVAAGASSGVFSATELIDTQALPVWLKQEGSIPPPAPPVIEEQAESLSKLSPLPAGFAKQQTGSFSATELVDTQALPAWLKGAADPSASLPPAPSTRSNPLSASEGEGFSAAELVDTQALPAWMKQGEAAGPLASPGPANFSGQMESGAAGDGLLSGSFAPEHGFSAPELIDTQALPSWLKEAGAEGRTEVPASAATSQPVQQGQPPRADLPGTGSLEGASLIDHKELPEWLQGQGNFERPGARAAGNEEEMPQARVPRRPRISTEVNRAPSQAAASVFSSVLGPTAGEDRAQAPSAGRGSPQQQAPRVGTGSATPQRGQMGQPSGARKGEESGGRAPASAASPGESWEDYAPGGARGDVAPPRRMPPMSETMREWEPPQGRRPPAGGQGFDRAGGPAAREQDAGGPPQWRDLQRQVASPNARRSFDEADWDGGPEMPLGYAEDGDVGPPSGVFAKIKRVLGFKR
jgi:hypothetical protein